MPESDTYLNHSEEDDLIDTRVRAVDVLAAISADPSEENIAQMEVFLEVFDIYLSRNRRHRSQWRVGGVGGLLVDLRKKVERLWNEFMLSPVPPADEDSAIDAINYAAFFIRARREQSAGKQVGSWLWPTAFSPAEAGRDGR